MVEIPAVSDSTENYQFSASIRSCSSAYINSMTDPDLLEMEKVVDYEKCHILRSVSGPIFCVITKNPKLD